jgi:hypothetical protein
MRGVSNGKELFLEDTGEKLYRQLPAPDLRNGDTEPFLWGGLLVDQFLDPKGLPGQTTYAGVRRLGKKRYQVVRIAAPSGRGTTDLYIGSSGLIEACSARISSGDTRVTMFQQATSVRLNLRLPPDRFAYKPRRGFTLAQDEGDPEQKLLAVGKPAPDFDLPVPGGGRLALSQIRNQKKAVLVNFWFYS